jgi:hypothetical protein
VLAAEALLRLIPRIQLEPRTFPGQYTNQPSENFIVDPATGWRMHPNHTFVLSKPEFRNTYHANAQGFRRNGDFDPAERRRKIVLIGDSFTFGIGVEYEETYGFQIESQLKDTVVYNLAMPGFAVDQMWLSLKYQALPLTPDLIVVGLVDTDLQRSQAAYRASSGFNKPAFKLVAGQLVPRTAEDRLGALSWFLEIHSRLWAAGWLTARSLSYRIPMGEWWFLNKAIIEQIRAECRESNTAVLFIYIPTKARRPFQTLHSYLTGVNADFIDVAVWNPAPPADFYYADDGHPTARGHYYIADKFIDWVQRSTAGKKLGFERRQTQGT